MAWSVIAPFQIQVEMDLVGGGSNPAWDHNLYSDKKEYKVYRRVLYLTTNDLVYDRMK